MEHRIEGNKEKLIRNCITFLLFGFALLTMIFIGNKKEIMLFIYSGICSVMFILIILYKFKTTPVEIIISDISSKFYITNFSAQMKVFEINNNDIRRVQAFYKNKKPNYINIIYLDQATGKLIRKKIYLVFMNNPEEVVNLLKEILNRVNS